MRIEAALRIALTEFIFIPEEIRAMKQSGLQIISMMHRQAQIALLRFAMTGGNPRLRHCESPSRNLFLYLKKYGR